MEGYVEECVRCTLHAYIKTLKLISKVKHKRERSHRSSAFDTEVSPCITGISPHVPMEEMDLYSVSLSPSPQQSGVVSAVCWGPQNLSDCRLAMRQPVIQP